MHLYDTYMKYKFELIEERKFLIYDLRNLNAG
jgi:hypothetical protein